MALSGQSDLPMGIVSSCSMAQVQLSMEVRGSAPLFLLGSRLSPSGLFPSLLPVCKVVKLALCSCFMVLVDKDHVPHSYQVGLIMSILLPS